MTIIMDPGCVDQAGDDLHLMATAAEARIKSLLRSTDDAVAGNSGWESAAALRAVRQAWEEHIDGLIEETVRVAEALKDCAGLVAAGDQEVANRLSSVLRDMGQL